jgi:hypothetical protein
VIAPGITGFLVNSVAEATAVLQEVTSIDENDCSARVKEKFSIATMVEGYERVYDGIFAREQE